MPRTLATLVTALVLGLWAVPVSPTLARHQGFKTCGSISGWTAAADTYTTTCGLARSATRSYLRRLGTGGSPDVIFARSPKTGRTYRLRFYRGSGTRTSSSNYYRGRAGEAVLRVRITGHLY